MDKFVFNQRNNHVLSKIIEQLYIYFMFQVIMILLTVQNVLLPTIFFVIRAMQLVSLER